MKTNITKEFTKEDVILALAEKYDLPEGAEVKFIGISVSADDSLTYLASCTYTLAEPPVPVLPTAEEISELQVGDRVRLRVLKPDDLDINGILTLGERFNAGDEINAFMDYDRDFVFECGLRRACYIYRHELENGFVEVLEIIPAEFKL